MTQLPHAGQWGGAILIVRIFIPNEAHVLPPLYVGNHRDFIVGLLLLFTNITHLNIPLLLSSR